MNADGIPLSLFDAPETRADVATTVPSTTGVNMSSVVPAVFAASIAGRLNIQMPMVGSGTYAAPRITTSGTAGTQAKGGLQESTAAAFTVATSSPKRVSARLTVQAEDIASFGNEQFESALRQNLQQVLSAELDEQILRGDGQGANLNGLVTQITDPTASTTVVTFQSFAGLIAGEIDGIFAESLGDLTFVCNPTVIAKLESTFSGTDAISIGDRMRGQLRGFYGHARMAPSSAANTQPASAANVATCLVSKGSMSADGATGRNAEMPTWSNLAIDDVYTDAGRAQRHFTVHAIVGDVLLLQPGAYSLVSVKSA